jgi:hypothetical protein
MFGAWAMNGMSSFCFPVFRAHSPVPDFPCYPRLSSISSKRRADIKQSNATRSVCAQECSEKDVVGWFGRPSVPLFRLPSDRHHLLSCVVCVASDAPVQTKAGFWASPTELFVSRHACLPPSFLSAHCLVRMYATFVQQLIIRQLSTARILHRKSESRQKTQPRSTCQQQPTDPDRPSKP